MLECKRYKTKNTKNLGEIVAKKKKKLAALADIGVVIKSEDLKVVFPYECVRSWERFEVKNLPSAKVLYSKLNLEGTYDNNHEHTQQVGNILEKKL